MTELRHVVELFPETSTFGISVELPGPLLIFLLVALWIWCRARRRSGRSRKG